MKVRKGAQNRWKSDGNGERKGVNVNESENKKRNAKIEEGERRRINEWSGESS